MFAHRNSLLSLFSAAALTLLAACAQAATLNVPSADYPTIQAAIDAAAPGDTVLVAPGTYPESLMWQDKDLVIQGAGAGQSIVDPSLGAGGRCLYTENLTSASRIEGFTFQNGSADFGGGMWNYSSSPTVTNCIFSGNSASITGGGMVNSISSPTVTNCAFLRNAAFLNGGGMWNLTSSGPTVINCTFISNSASVTGGGIGSVAQSHSTVTNCILWGNSSGGIFHDVRSSSVVTFSDVQGLPNATPDPDTGNFAVDPLFVDAPNGDLRLLPGSPCINRGNNAVVVSPPFFSVGGTIVDLAGNARIAGAAVDLGAYENSNSAPIANAGPDQSVEATGYTTEITLDGSNSFDPDGDSLLYEWRDASQNIIAAGTNPAVLVNLPKGSHTFTLTVSDGNGGIDEDTIVVNVVDTTAPVLSAVSATPNVLSPPNHQMVMVRVNYTAYDLGDAAPLCWLTVTSNEPDNGLGDGDTPNDIEIVDARTVRLRAERSGKGKGRLYTITVHSVDASGNLAAPKTVTVTVPR